MADERPPEVGWLHYRLAVAFCAAMVMGLTLLVVPLFLGIAGRGAEPLVLWSEIGAWLEEHDRAAAVLGFAAVALVISFLWYGFR